MTEKRFHYVKPSSEHPVPRIYDKEKNTTETYAPHQLISLLNELSEENQKLKETPKIDKFEIPLDEIEDIVVDYKGRITHIYYED